MSDVTLTAAERRSALWFVSRDDGNDDALVAVVERIIADRLAVLDDYLGCANGFHAEACEAAIEHRDAS